MTGSFQKRSNEPSWKKDQRQGNLKNLLAVFLAVVLTLAATNAIFKSFRVPKLFTKIAWDGKSPFAVVLSTKPPAVLVYQAETKKVVIFKLSEDFYGVDALSKNDPQGLKKVSSLVFRANIANYIIFRDGPQISEEWSKKTVSNFSSFVSPFSILARGLGPEVVSTNIGRIDLFRLWWQAKSFSVNDLKWEDLTAEREEIIKPSGEKVLGVDSISLNRRISEYLQIHDIRMEGAKVNIVNYSGRPAAASLAGDMVSVAGANVLKVSTGDLNLDKTLVVSDKTYPKTASYLAKIFNCDIKPSPEEIESGQITIMLGSDFSNLYFR